MAIGNFLYFGDSVMGQAPTDGYIHHLANWIYSQDQASRHHFLNIGGNGSKDILERIVYAIPPRTKSGNIRMIVVSIGIVDSSFFREGEETRAENTLKGYSANMQGIFDISRKYTSSIVVPGLTRINDLLKQPLSPSGRLYDNSRIEEFDSELRRVCELNNGTYVPIHDVLLPEDFVDGLHPNSSGHFKIFGRIVESGRIKIGA